jgi:hypothetical protein
MISRILRALAIARMKRELRRNLAARRTLRPYRQQAALKGWQTRRSS